MRKSFIAVSLAMVLGAPLVAVAADQDDPPKEISNSVVKIFSTLRFPDSIRPWRKQSPQEASGTGVVLEGKRILTNAHVVLYASQVFVQPNESGEKIAASVESIGPGIDLAVLKLEDESFFETRPPLVRAKDLPETKDSVLVYGYPQGGSSLSITKGIVSRIEFSSYYSQTSGVRIQIDAAINPGNSGGPAIVDGKMIGLIFSRLREADNIGYIIPTEEIELFLKDVADGSYDGKPMVFDELQTLENDALRAKLKLDRKTSGMVVHRPDRDDSDYPLKKWDLLTKIGDHEIDNVGMVRVKENLRMSYRYYIQKLAHDHKVPFTIIRDGKEQTIELPVVNNHDDLVFHLEGKYPSYFVYGPLVFTPVSSEFLSDLDRAGNRLFVMLSTIGSPLVTRRSERRKVKGEELVVIPAPMFPHKIAKGYSNPVAKVVKEVNGISIKSLKHLVEVLRDTDDRFITIVFDDRNSETLVFERKEIEQATEEVLNDNGVRQQYSDDLASLWKKQ